MVDYQYIRLPGDRSLDLLGYHLLHPVNDWLYFGIGSFAPVTQGDYGGFMAFGGILHAQHRMRGNWTVNGGLALGGGGGGESVELSDELSGTGGYAKAYAGIGYDFGRVTAGANISRMAFFESEIDGTQLNLYLQLPFAYRTGPHSQAGQSFSYHPDPGSSGRAGMISAGLDNYLQQDPQGSNTGTIRTVDLQVSRYFRENRYWYYALGVGYEGLPLYNQVIAGLGARQVLSPRVSLYGQLGIGSGGYAPSVIDTGSGFLVYPKVSAEYMIRPNLGLALTAGYLFAPDGTSENITVGAALNYHMRPPSRANSPGGAAQGRFAGYRFSVSHETKTNLRVGGAGREDLGLITIQGDKILNDHFYVPIRGSIAYDSYRGYPGYGEVSAGVGWQSKYSSTSRWQFFGDVQAGAYVDGRLLRAGLGAAYALSPETALRGMVSHTIGDDSFAANSLELGWTYRFSLPVF